MCRVDIRESSEISRTYVWRKASTDFKAEVGVAMKLEEEEVRYGFARGPCVATAMQVLTEFLPSTSTLV